MATKYIAIAFFFALVVMLPIHRHETGDWGLPSRGNLTNNNSTASTHFHGQSLPLIDVYGGDGLDVSGGGRRKLNDTKPTDPMLWMYVLFVYFFSGLLFYLVVTETKKIIRIRQDYLGSQSTITDRTIRISGIPEALRSEDMIQEAIENLQIGKVESVLLCRDWRELDELVAKRMSVLRKLEEAWTVYMGHPKRGGNKVLLQGSTPGPHPHDEESLRLLDGDTSQQDCEVTGTADRPKTRIWYGFLGLQSRLIDAIDYYEEKLRKLDEQIKSSRKKVFKPMPIAFVTLDSTAAAVSKSCIDTLERSLITTSKWPYKPRWILSL